MKHYWRSALHIRSSTSTETTLELSTKGAYNGTLPSAKISFTQQNGTEIARIKCDTSTGAANMADLTFWTNYGGLYERMRITKTGQVLCSSDETFADTALHSNGNASLVARGDTGAWAAKLLCRHSQNDYAYLGFASQDGSENLCSIYGYRAGTSTGDMSFGTCNGANSAVERLRIKANGNIGIGDFGTNTIPQKKLSLPLPVDECQNCRQNYSFHFEKSWQVMFYGPLFRQLN